MVKIYNFEQETPEWYAVRLGKMTASHASEIGNCGKGLDSYTMEKAAELFTGKTKKLRKNSAMINGVNTEPLARFAYEMERGVTIQQIGFAEYNDYVGASPDGLVGEDGGIEIKSRDSDEESFSNTHLKLLFGVEKFDSKHVWQCHMNMFVFDRKWWDLMSFDPAFKEKSLFIERIYRSPKHDEALITGFSMGEAMIKNKLEKLRLK